MEIILIISLIAVLVLCGFLAFLLGKIKELMEVEKNYYRFYTKSRNRILINLCQIKSLQQTQVASNKLL